MNLLSFILITYSLIIAPLHAKNILVVGDSLSAGYGINPEKGWVNLLSEKLTKEGQFRIINVSTSGDTTSNGLTKFSRAMEKYKPEIVIIELGANDGLRGLSLGQMQKNLEAMLKESKKADAKVLLLGIYLPPNYGPQYLEGFKKVFTDLAQSYQVAFVPMFLEGVAGNQLLMQSDGLHPNEQAQPIILNNIWPALNPLL